MCTNIVAETKITEVNDKETKTFTIKKYEEATKTHDDNSGRPKEWASPLAASVRRCLAAGSVRPSA